LNVELLGSAAVVQKSAVVSTPEAAGLHLLPISVDGVTSTIAFLASEYAQSLEQEPNDKLEQAQTLTIPRGVSGRMDKPRDVDYFTFEGKKGQAIGMEVMARRFGTPWNSPLDSVLDILDAKGKLLASNDDGEGKDSRLIFSPPADGRYYARLRDLHHRGGPEFAYYLQATYATPDFRLYFDPDKLAAAPGASTACFVHLERLNGFKGPVSVKLEGLPAGMTASALTIPSTMTQGVVVVTAAPTAHAGAGVFRVIGSADLAGRDGAAARVQRLAAPREEIYVPGGGRGLFQVQTAVAAISSIADIAQVEVEPSEIVLAPGKEVRLTVRVRRQRGFDKSISLDVLLRHLQSVFGNPLPPGVTMVDNKSKTLLGTGSEGVIVLRAAPDAKPIERTPLAVQANVSVNFMVKTSYSSPVLWLTVRKQP
jgi:hypothetical protein